MDLDDLLRGALCALVNSASLVEAAAHLYQAGHDQGCLILAVSAREEIGRFALLASRASRRLKGVTSCYMTSSWISDGSSAAH